jgi:MSHA biogenesis protein MshL
MPFRFSVCALAALVLTGCALPSITSEQMQNRAEQRASAAVAAFEKSSKPVAAVREVAAPMVDFRKTEQSRVRGDVTLRAASTPFAPILSQLGRKLGYSVAYSETVDVNRKVTVDFNDAMTEDAIRTTAFLAGYAAVIDKNQRTVMVSDVATYTFRLPSSVFTELQATYNVGGNPANSASSQGGSSGGGGSGGSSLRADFSISGKEGSNPGGLSKFLQDIAGRNAEVFVSDSGHISVRANAQSLRRVHEFMKGFARDAMTQIEIEASVVEVSLAKDFQLGIQWGKVVNAASIATLGGGSTAAILNAASGNTADMLTQLGTLGSAGTMSSFRTSANSSSLITALAQFTDVNVVSQPKLVSLNNVPATFFDGTQVPYLGKVEQTAATGNGEPTVTGSVAFAIDGVSFSAVPSVIDSNTVQITLIPVLSSINGMDEFLGGTLKAPRQGNKQTYMRVLAESGKTLILGGIRYNKENSGTTLPSSTNKSSSTKEIVILLRANVIPAPNFDPIVSESL